MSVVLKNNSTSLSNWFIKTYPDIPIDCVSFAKESVNQNTLNPYESQAIIIYKIEEDRICVKGFIYYGDYMINAIGITLKLQVLSPYIKQKPFQICNSEEDVTMDNLKTRIDWIAGKSDGIPLDFPPSHFLLQIGPYISKFYTKQLNVENKHFFQKIRNFNEKSMFDLLQVNDLLKHLDFLDLPTIVDYQHEYPKAKPCIWFNVPIDELPTEMSNSLCLYPGGIFHVPCVRMGPWIWRRITKITKCVSDHPEQVLHLFAYMNDVIKPKSIKRNREHIDLQFEERYPECVKQIIFGKQFPLDEDRQHLVRILTYGGVSLEYIGEKLDALNAKYPHKNGAISAKRRWDYESHHKAGYHPPRCEKMKCPLNPGKEIDIKKSTCLKMYMSKFPNEKIPHPKTFYGPHSWFEW